ncbi:rsbT co-antagonist protein RsbR [Flavobacterium sp. 270]|uniref:STAS domain-containing protein n=1 Tax=Flavobacterium sp. 270 TaxID=2512114 RepID=UPI0010655398|nr:STAS domain-containing protein [Flavobacterium sp. 270]TDW47826.1 rsbT co-antagonist protein RsbR [Flavobacterium sp. 270]
MSKNILGALTQHESKLNTLWLQFLLEKGLSDGATEEDESKEFIRLFIETLNHGATSKDLNSHVFDKIYELLSGITISRAKRGFSPRETAFYIISFKEAASKILSDITNDTVHLYTANLELNNIIDHLIIMTFESFMQGREEIIVRQNNEISQISTPVIQVWEGVVVLPIIGTLDSSRAQSVTESLLQQITETGSSIAILDISGVPAVDSLVAQHLIKTVSATRLMGGECIISGVRPEIAQTVIHLGIELTNIITKATLENALQTAFGMMQIVVMKK